MDKKDTSIPWYIKALGSDETNWQEVCYNIQIAVTIV